MITILYNQEHCLTHDEEKEVKNEKSTVYCSCGCKQFLVNWIKYPYVGGYCKLTCPACGAETVLIDDYS